MASKKEKRFNGKPMSHWRRLAHELVIAQLVGASRLDTRSIVGKIASERIMDLAKGIDPEEVKQALQRNHNFQIGITRALTEMLGSSTRRRRPR